MWGYKRKIIFSRNTEASLTVRKQDNTGGNGYEKRTEKIKNSLDFL